MAWEPIISLCSSEVAGRHHLHERSEKCSSDGGTGITGVLSGNCPLAAGTDGSAIAIKYQPNGKAEGRVSVETHNYKPQNRSDSISAQQDQSDSVYWPTSITAMDQVVKLFLTVR